MRPALLLLLGLTVCANAADGTNSSRLYPGQYLTHWLILKPIPVAGQNSRPVDDAARRLAFDQDWLAAQGGEAQAAPQAGAKVKVAGQMFKWQPLALEVAAANLAQQDNAMAYGYAEFELAGKQAAFLGVGSDENVKVWLNGKLVHQHWVCRGVRLDEDLVPVEFQAGKNRLLLKVQNSTGPWGVACRVLSPEQAQGLQMIKSNADSPNCAPLTDADIQTLLQDNIDTDKQNVGLVVGIIDAQGRHIISHGKLDNGTERKVDGDTLFEIGSITKVFTALLLQDMIERGEMKLDDPVQRYLPASVRMPTYQGRQITLLHLATHTSGLPRDIGDLSSKSFGKSEVEQLYGALSHYRLPRAPGTREEYSNLGAALLGHAIALKAGQDYETLVRERICRPLGMESTCIRLSPEQKARLAIGHAMPGRRVHSMGMGDANPALPGAGYLRSTANDLLKFAAAYSGLTPSPLGPLMEKAEAVHSLELGAKRRLIWFGEDAVFEHGGTTEGYRTELAFDKSRRRAVVVLANCIEGPFVQGMWRRLLQGHSPKPVHTAPIAPAAYDRYVGQYRQAGGAVWSVQRQGERLVVRRIGKPGERLGCLSVEMFPQSESVFYNRLWDVPNEPQNLSRITFVRDSQGHVVQLVVSSAYTGGETTRFSSEPMAVPDPLQLDSAVYDRYVGQYRAGFLFGLIHLGPTLNIRHQKDELGEHLFASARGLGGAELFPNTQTRFILDATVGTGQESLTFVQNKTGKTTGVVLFWDGAIHHGDRIAEKPAKN